MDLQGVRVTWLGHGTFKIASPSGKIILLDPWLQDNPACPDDQKHPGKLDIMLVTHGHFDHIGNAVAAARGTARAGDRLLRDWCMARKTGS